MGDDTPLDDLVCQVVASERVEVASPVAGIIQSVEVDRGDRVTKGQVLVTLRADMEKADVALAESKANTSAVLRSKETTLAFAERKLERNADLRRRNLISENDLDQLTTERDNAKLDLESAREQQKISALELAKARVLLDIRTIRSPTDGLVTERNLPPGNLVAEKPVVVINKTDPLYIEVALPANLYGRVKIGDAYRVSFSVPGVGPRDVKVSLVDTVIDSASNTFGVRLVLDNPDSVVPAGAKCHVAFPEN